MKTIEFNTTAIINKNTFHAAFEALIDYPNWYSDNLDGWIDMISYFDQPASDNPRQRYNQGELYNVHVLDAEGFFDRAPSAFRIFIIVVNQINSRYIEKTGKPIMAITLV